MNQINPQIATEHAAECQSFARVMAQRLDESQIREPRMKWSDWHPTAGSLRPVIKAAMLDLEERLINSSSANPADITRYCADLACLSMKANNEFGVK